MKNALIIILAVQSVILLISEVLADEEKYTTRYDDIDIDSVIRNDRLLNSYVGCLLGRNACTPDAAELKNALATDCAACSDTQKRIADKVSHHLIDHKAEQWKLLEEKYDPTGNYKKLYLEKKQ